MCQERTLVTSRCINQRGADHQTEKAPEGVYLNTSTQ